VVRVLLASLLLTFLPLGALGAAERFACNMTALTKAERARHAELSRTLLGSVAERSELRDGYAFRLSPARLMDAAQWVSFERRCCPFFAFRLKLAKNEGPLWLEITGAPGVKPFIREEFRL
jgi:hypothetical protein